MRFLQVNENGEYTLTDDLREAPGPYATLSHTWGADNDEVTFDDLQNKHGKDKKGYEKLDFCVNQSQKFKLNYVWIDTCCINKANLSELDEAIRSMFRWYRNAAMCWLYLSDVCYQSGVCGAHEDKSIAALSWEAAFGKSRWFTRGWTLQELLAPSTVEFFSHDGYHLGSKQTLAQQVHEVTQIPTAALNSNILSSFSIDERLRWAKDRTTSKVEDRAYCLFGIFNVFLPVMYGEGEHAFTRLREEIGITITQIDSAIRQTYDSGRLRIVRLSGETLPLQDCFINLSVVEHCYDSGTKSTNPSSDEFSSKGDILSPFSLDARLKVETPGSTRVPLETLFNMRKREDGSQFRPTRVLIWGRAGMGKTTLCKKMVHDFYHNDLWKSLYDRVVWLPLRKLKLMENHTCNTIELVQKEFAFNSSEKKLAERLDEAVVGSDRTLFLLDGLDEVSYTLDMDTSIGQVLAGLLTRDHIIITSRPHATNILDLDPPNLELETIGFLPQQVNEYVHRVFQRVGASDKEISDLQSTIQNRPLVQSLARIPIQLDAICYSWRSRRFPKDNITMTTLYCAISHKLWAKDIVRLGKVCEGKLITPQQIQQTKDVEVYVEKESRYLQELAFWGLCSETIEFDAAETPGCHILGDGPVHMSFLRSSDNSVEAIDQTLHFIHLTFQEFFAARYFVSRWISAPILVVSGSPGHSSFKSSDFLNPEGFLKAEKYNGRYDIFWRFVIGLLCDQAKSEAERRHLYRFFRVLEEEPYDVVGLAHQRLIMHCLSEVNLTTGDVQNIVREREESYLEWILCESKQGTYQSHVQTPRTSLMWEPECSDYVVEKLLECPHTKNEVMDVLCRRVSVSPSILDKISRSVGVCDSNASIGETAVQILGQQCGRDHGETFLCFWKSVQDLDLRRVIEALGRSRILQLPALDALALLLQHANADVRGKAARALGRQHNLPGPAVEALVLLLQDAAAGVREEAAGALGRQHNLPGPVVEALVLLLQDADTDVRREAATALRGQDSLSGPAVEALVLLLQHADAGVRTEAAWALGRHHRLPGPAVKALVLLLQHAGAGVREEAATALRCQDSLPGPAVEALVLLLQHADAGVRTEAAWALGHQHHLPGPAIKALVLLLQHADTDVRREAVTALKGQESLPGPAVEALVLLLQDTDVGVRTEGAIALKRHHHLPGPAVEALILLLQDADAGVREEAAWALGGQDNLPASAIEALVLLLQYAHTDLCREAARALRGQDSLPEPAVKALVFLLQDADMGVRGKAATALRGQESLPGPAIEALALLLQDSDVRLQDCAAESLLYQEHFYARLLDFSPLVFRNLLLFWLRNKSVTCTIGYDELYVNVGAFRRNFPLKNGQNDLFMKIWTEAREQLDIPAPLMREQR